MRYAFRTYCTDKEEKYNCPYKYINYDSNKDWQKKTYWFLIK